MTLIYCLLRDMIQSVESFIISDKEVLYEVMVTLRADYSLFLPNRTSFTKASVKGSVSGVIDEVSHLSVCL